jgi:hypothetical protein
MKVFYLVCCLATSSCVTSFSNTTVKVSYEDGTPVTDFYMELDFVCSSWGRYIGGGNTSVAKRLVEKTDSSGVAHFPGDFFFQVNCPSKKIYSVFSRRIRNGRKSLASDSSFVKIIFKNRSKDCPIDKWACSDQEKFYRNVTSDTGNACKGIRYFSPYCLAEHAARNNNISFCKKALSIDYPICLHRYIAFKRDPSLCKYGNDKNNKSCYRFIAKYLEDASICNRIGWHYDIKNCRDFVARSGRPIP